MVNAKQIIEANARAFVWNYVPWVGNFIRFLKGRPDFLGGTDHVPSQVLDVLRRYSEVIGEETFSVAGKVCLELGTGNSPDIAFLMMLSGASRSIMLDTAQLLNVPFQNGKEYQELVATLQSAAMDRIKFVNVPETVTSADLDRLASGLEYLTYDGITLPLPDASVDIVYSKSVLEHVRHPDSLFEELRRISKPGALHLHIIDLRDHFKIIDDYSVKGDWLEFLVYDEKTWEKKCTNTYAWCNRLRLPAWRDLLQASNFEIIRQEVTRLDLPKRLPSPYTEKDLDVAWWMVLMTPKFDAANP
jgi:SAM-dependent methyltransferase